MWVVTRLSTKLPPSAVAKFSPFTAVQVGPLYVHPFAFINALGPPVPKKKLSASIVSPGSAQRPVSIP